MIVTRNHCKLHEAHKSTITPWKLTHDILFNSVEQRLSLSTVPQISDGRFQLCYYLLEEMNKSYFGKLVVLVVLFSVAVVGVSAWFIGTTYTWQLFSISIFAGILGSILIWWFWQHDPPTNADEAAKILLQQEEIEDLRQAIKSIQLEKEQLEQAVELSKQDSDQALQARTTFLNNIGHELRTPLSVILGYADIILQNAQRENDEQLIALTQKIKLYTKGFSATINDVLQISEIESGQVGFFLEAFGIETIIDQAVIQSQAYLDVNENNLMLIVSPDIGTMVSDRDKVRAILANLLSNAAKFTTNGTITLSAKSIINDDQPWIVFQVADTGIGISPEKQTQIFQPFLQGDNSFTKEHGGVGLGLAINQHYCQLMGGRIELESIVGEGSTFSVYLPVEVTAVDSMFMRSSTPAPDTV